MGLTSTVTGELELLS
jgi:hypothetical protein